MSTTGAAMAFSLKRPRPLSVLLLVSLLLGLWQTPWTHIIHRQLGTRSFLWEMFRPAGGSQTVVAESSGLWAARSHLLVANTPGNVQDPALNTYRTLVGRFSLG